MTPTVDFSPNRYSGHQKAPGRDLLTTWSYRFSPPGPEGQLGGARRLAGHGGRLVGSLVGDRVRLWLAQTDGELLATIWPGEYRARLEPLALLDEDARVIAHGGERVQVVGGFLPSGDPVAAEHNRGVFFVSLRYAVLEPTPRWGALGVPPV